jgi:hypothetical protein
MGWRLVALLIAAVIFIHLHRRGHVLLRILAVHGAAHRWANGWL